MPVTLRFQSTGSVPGDGAPIVMKGPSLTIGRGPENDVVLPDPDRLISKNHCAIEDQGGDVVVIDFSTNGTFLNYGKTPLGRVPTPLNDGDVLTMGAYELVVAILSAGRSSDPFLDLPAPVAEGPVSHGSADVTPESLLDLLNDPGAKRVDFLDDLMGGHQPLGPSQIVREDPVDSLMLPHIGDGEDPILGPIPEPLDDFGPSLGAHSAAVNDSFSAAPRRDSLIPDDWDDDFLRPAGKAPSPDPFAGTPAAPPPAAAAPSRAPATPVVPKPVPDLPPSDLQGLVRPAAAAPRPSPAVSDAAPARPGGESPFAAPANPDRLAASVVPPPPPIKRAPVAPAPPAAAAPVPPAIVAPTASAPAVVAPGSVDAARAFFKGAGAEDVVISDAEMTETMERLGRVMSILIGGLREILMTRTQFKSEFRISRTMIGAGGNNPLKFSLSAEHAVEAILRPKAKGYMDSTTSIEEALKDIKAHEVAMVTGMEAAIKDVLSRLDPKALEEKLGTGGGIGDLLKGRKSRYWEVYEKLYAEIAEQAEQDFHEFFSKEFAKAYQKQLERLK